MTDVGRPPIFNSVDELQQKIDNYFNNCPDKRILSGFDKNSGEFVTMEIATPTITGLAYYLGFESRQSFYDYEKKKDFSYTIKKARLKIELEYEKQLWNDKCTGAIFALKNLGWKDKVENEIVSTESTQEAFLQHLKDLGKTEKPKNTKKKKKAKNAD